MSSEINGDEYYSVSDIDTILFSKEATQQIVLYEKTVEIVGIVEHVEIKNNLMKFTITNKENDLIQMLIWDENIISNVKSKIMSGNVLHIDGAFARPRNATLSSGTIDYDLVISSNTEIRVLKIGSYISPSEDSTTVPVVSIEESVKYSSTIKVEGYIKNPINQISLPNAKIRQGCISDCKSYKLEIRMPIFDNMEEFPLGSHVFVTGILKYTQHPYLWITHKSNIVLASDEKKKINELLKGNKMPKRVLDSSMDFVNSPIINLKKLMNILIFF